MPTLTTDFQAADGPIIRVGILVSALRRDALKNANRAVPDPVIISALVDTGASSTVVDPSVIMRLGIPPTGSTSIGTPSTGSGSHSCLEYDAAVAITLDDGQYHMIDNLPIVEAELAPFGFHALLGRDILSQGLFIFNGPAGKLTLAF